MPSVSAAVVNGDAQVAKAVVSTRHWKLEPASVDANENVGVLSLLGVTSGVSVVSGATVSMTKVCDAGVASWLPAASVARTSKVCVPSVSAAVVNGVAQLAKAAVSTRHWKLDPVSVEVKL